MTEGGSFGGSGTLRSPAEWIVLDGRSPARGLVDAVSVRPAFMPGDPRRHVRRVRYGDDCICVDGADAVSLVVNLSEAHEAVRRSEGSRIRAEPRVGAVTLIPPACPTAFEIIGTAQVLMLQLSWAVIRRAVERDGRDQDRVALQARLAYDDPVLARLFYAAAASPDDDSLVPGIVARLVEAHAAHPRRARRTRAGLPTARLARVKDRIEAELAGPLGLETLASEAGLSLHHFAREFRRVTGLSPYAYVVKRRVDRAVMLLAQRERSVADIAMAAGFAHASHLAFHLRRRTGQTPSVFRTRILP